MNIVQALDARTGDLIWEHHVGPNALIGQAAMRNMAIYQDKVFVATTDARLVALDARTGTKVWDTPIADRAKGYANTAGPMVDERRRGQRPGRLRSLRQRRLLDQRLRRGDRQAAVEVQHRRARGTSRAPTRGASWPTTCASAARPGSPAATIPISISPTGAWRRRSRGCARAAARRISTTCSTRARRSRCSPKDGTLAWHYQHAPGESLDLDEVFERVLVDIGDQKVVFTIGKPGILWKLDRRTGQFLGYKETIFQNVFESIDPKTGTPKYRADILEQQTGQWVQSCPSTEGGHNWQAMSYSRPSGVLDHPAQPVVHGDVRPQDRVQPTGRAAPARIAASSRCPAPTATSASSRPTTSRR